MKKRKFLELVMSCSIIFFSSCDLEDFKLKGRNNPDDSLFERSIIELTLNSEQSFRPYDESISVFWKINSKNGELINPAIKIFRNQTLVFSFVNIKQEDLSGILNFNPIDYGFGHLDMFQVHFVQQTSKSKWIDSLEHAVLLFDETKTPIFSNLTPKSIQKNSFEFEFDVIKLGLSPLTDFFVCMNKSGNPTISDIKQTCNLDASDGEKVNVFFNDLQANSPYYFRIYSKSGTSENYTNQQVFSTVVADKPILGNTQITNISSSTALLNSIIENDGGSEILEKGFCFDTKDNPDISKSVVQSVLSSNSLQNSIGNLTRKTIYYVRSYAKNTAGISYGPTATFTTSDFKTLYMHNCNQFQSTGFNNFSAKCKYWTGVAYGYSDWEISPNGYNGNCIAAVTPRSFPIGGYVQFSYSSNTTSQIKLWVLAVQGGYNNRMPNIMVDGVSFGPATLIQGSINSADWMRIESPDIPSGNHSIKIEWGDIGTSYTYRVDEIIIAN